MKYPSFLMFILALSTPTWAEPVHPLKDVARTTLLTYSDLYKLAEDNASESGEVWDLARTLRDQAEELYLRALLVQVNYGREYLKSVGLSFTYTELGAYEIETGPEYKAMRQQAREMNAEGWDQFLAINKLLEPVSWLAQDTHNASLGSGVHVSDRVQLNLNRVLHLHLYQHYQDFAKLGERVLGCIDYFGKAYVTTGLKPEWSGSEFYWSKPELYKVFGVRDVKDLNPSAKAKFLETLGEYKNKMYQYREKCGAEHVNDFFHVEFRRLGGQP